MYEYEVRVKATGEVTFMWGYSWNNALRRSKTNNDEVECLYFEYVD